ncbi:uncharacterized protein TNCV_372011 [Trichonephila clavipes]|nr:uncharacterized protein TNCV_372011 [Trichonephila clavipes]
MVRDGIESGLALQGGKDEGLLLKFVTSFSFTEQRIGHLETITHRKDLSLNEIANSLRELSENESDGDVLSCSNLDSDDDILLHESDCDESDESADEIDNIPVNPNIYVTRNGTEWILHHSNFPGRFATQNALRQSSGPTSFRKHNTNVS